MKLIALLAGIGWAFWGVDARASSWQIELNPHEAHCKATYLISGGGGISSGYNASFIHFRTNPYLRKLAFPSENPNKLTMEWQISAAGVHRTSFGSDDFPHYTATEGLLNKNGYDYAGHWLDLEIRLFPDDGQGFEPVRILAGRCGDGPCGHSTSFYLLDVPDSVWDRLSEWGQARRNPNDPSTWVWLPEVRIILRWNYHECIEWDNDGNCSVRNDNGYERYWDIPLWRAGNAINKLKSCVAQIGDGTGL